MNALIEFLMFQFVKHCCLQASVKFQFLILHLMVKFQIWFGFSLLAFKIVPNTKCVWKL